MTTLATAMNLSNRKAPEHSGYAESQMSDLDLLLQVQGRSRRALEVLYDRYSSKAFGLAFKMLRDRDVAEEIVIDAFWRVWERAEQFQLGRGSFASWFYGIVRHLALDELRRRDARPIPGDDNELEMAMASDVTREYDMTEQVATSLVAETVRDALNALPPLQRQVIQLAYIEGLTRKEISKHLGQPLGTIHTRARLGLEKLRVLLAPSQQGLEGF